jgi:hypothetical protein
VLRPAPGCLLVAAYRDKKVVVRCVFRAAGKTYIYKCTTGEREVGRKCGMTRSGLSRVSEISVLELNLTFWRMVFQKLSYH